MSYVIIDESFERLLMNNKQGGDVLPLGQSVGLKDKVLNDTMSFATFALMVMCL